MELLLEIDTETLECMTVGEFIQHLTKLPSDAPIEVNNETWISTKEIGGKTTLYIESY